MRNIFLKKLYTKCGRETSPIQKAFYEVKKKEVSTLALIYFGKPRLGHTIKTQIIILQTVDSEIRSIMIFNKIVWE